MRAPTGTNLRIALLTTLLLWTAASGRAAGAGPTAAAAEPSVAVVEPSVAVAESASATSAHDSTVERWRAVTVDSLGATDSTSLAGSFSVTPRDYVQEVRQGFTPESRAYATTRSALAIIEPLYGILVGLFILYSGLAARMRDVAHSLGHRRYVRVLVFIVLYSLAGLVLSFPLTFYQSFALEHRYGLSNQGFGAWLGDLGKGELLAIALFGLVPLVKLAYDAIERNPRTWGRWLAAGTLPVIVAGALLEPVVVDPLFNQFTPLAEGRLKHEILALADRAGIPARNVYVADKSAQTKKYNAYVNGIGASQRIVLWDTMLEGMREDEILFVMGHEMGHYRLHHVWKGLALVGLLGIVLFTLTAAIVRRAIARWGRRWHISEAHDVASLPLLVLTLSLVSFLAQPLVNAVSRRFEHEADVYALELTHANDSGARAFIALASQNRSNPEPPRLVELVLFSHPPLVDRIRFAIGYRPWEEGKPNRVFEPGLVSGP
jgi:Zn-dependent protease with chaperone function